MITISGEVRKVLPSQYTNKNTGIVEQKALLIIEPEDSYNNYQVALTSKQISSGAIAKWLELKGKKASVNVTLYVNHEHKFYKFSAVSDGLPLVN